MTGSEVKQGELVAVLLSQEGAPLTRAVRRTLVEGGFEVAAVTSRWIDALEQAVDAHAHVVVTDLALTGRPGLRFVRALRALAPECAVVVISPLTTIDVAALEAGAVEVIDPSDLRPLSAVLERIASEQVHT